MAETIEKKADPVEDRVARLEKKVGYLDRKRIEMRDNWKQFFSRFVSNQGDGRIGS